MRLEGGAMAIGACGSTIWPTIDPSASGGYHGQNREKKRTSQQARRQIEQTAARAGRGRRSRGWRYCHAQARSQRRRRRAAVAPFRFRSNRNGGSTSSFCRVFLARTGIPFAGKRLAALRRRLRGLPCSRIHGQITGVADNFDDRALPGRENERGLNQKWPTFWLHRNRRKSPARYAPLPRFRRPIGSVISTCSCCRCCSLF